MPYIPASLKKALFQISFVITLTACGGGGGETAITEPSTPIVSNSKCTNSSPDNNTPSVVLTTDCTGNYCGAVNPSTFSGSGVGVWSGLNSSNNAATALVNLNSIAGKSVTLLWTNLDSSSTQSPPFTSYISDRNSNSKLQIERLTAAQATFRQQLPALLKQNSVNAFMTTSIVTPAYAVGNSKIWYDYYNGTVTTTLRSQAILSNGNKVNIWVQNSEWNPAGGNFKVTQAMVNLLRDQFSTAQSGIYDMVTALTGGQPWGAHSHINTMISAPQDIQIVIANITPDKQPSGLLGYFYSYNNTLKTAGAEYKNSNEALMFFVDSETLASPTDRSNNQAAITSVLAHEFTHMINYYERTVVPSADRSFDSWMEETTAMMMQNIVEKKLSPDYYTLTKNWFPDWISKDAASNCSLTDAFSNGSSCFSYNLGGTYGGYLLRQYGLGFYKDLLQSTDTSSISALNNTIKKYDSSADFGISVRHWGASIALLDSSKLPTGFGYPERTDTVNGITYTLPSINGSDFASLRYLAPLPTSLKPYAHAAQSCTAESSFYKRVNIPAGTALTVIVN